VYSTEGKETTLANIFIINALIVFIYAVLFSSLTIYLTRALSFKTIEAENLAGLFLALNFILHLLSGYLGERFISNRQILFVSGVIQLVGTILLSHASGQEVFLGLSMLVIGCGLNTTSL
jgi:dipeptide/tripeptide permease